MATKAMMTINSGNHQRGVSLIEAMVAALVLAILFIGLAHVLARGLVSQRYVNTQNLALLEMREVLQTQNNICSSTPSLTHVGNVLLQPACSTRGSVEITVGSVPKKELSGTDLPRNIQLTTADSASEGLFGGVIMISDN